MVEALIIALPVTEKPPWVLITSADPLNTTLPLPLAVAAKVILASPPVLPISLKKLISPLLVFKVRVRTAVAESIVLLKVMLVPETAVIGFIERFCTKTTGLTKLNPRVDPFILVKITGLALPTSTLVPAS